MEISNIINSNSLRGVDAGKTEQSLGKNDFLNLLVTQMQNQDPLNPMDNQAMLSQMAQFSSLEQMSNLNDTMKSANEVSAFMDATKLLGTQIEMLNPSAPIGSNQTLTAKVESISYSANGPILKLDNGLTASVTDIVKVSESQG